MADASATELTELLNACAKGDTAAFDRLVPKVYVELQRLARSQLRRRPQNTLDTGSLVNEAYLKLAAQEEPNWRNRAHFFTASAQAMRHILVDAARRRLSKKRGEGENPEPLSDHIRIEEPHAEDVLAVHQALEKLQAMDADLCRTVECRFFAGLSTEETAAALGVSERTAHRNWVRARAWLRVLMNEGSEPNSPPKTEEGK